MNARQLFTLKSIGRKKDQGESSGAYCRKQKFFVNPHPFQLTCHWPKVWHMAGRLGNVALQLDSLLLLTESASVGKREMDIESNHCSYTAHTNHTFRKCVGKGKERDKMIVGEECGTEFFF